MARPGGSKSTTQTSGWLADGRRDGGVGVAGLGALRRVCEREPEAGPRREVIRGDQHPGFHLGRRRESCHPAS